MLNRIKTYTILILNEGPKIKVAENMYTVDEKIVEANKDEKKHSNFIALKRGKFFGFKVDYVRVNLKRILFYYPA